MSFPPLPVKEGGEMADIFCARCGKFVRDEECQGESGLYSPDRSFMLWEPCFQTEDDEIEVRPVLSGGAR